MDTQQQVSTFYWIILPVSVGFDTTSTRLVLVPISSPHTEDPNPTSNSDLSSSWLVLLGVAIVPITLQLAIKSISMVDGLLPLLGFFSFGDRILLSDGTSFCGDTTPESWWVLLFSGNRLPSDEVLSFIWSVSIYLIIRGWLGVAFNYYTKYYIWDIPLKCGSMSNVPEKCLLLSIQTSNGYFSRIVFQQLEHEEF